MELTTTNLYAFLERLDIKEDDLLKLKIGSNFQDFQNLVKKLLDQFYPDYKNNTIKIKCDGNGPTQGRIFINSICKNSVFNNVTELSFVNFYPQIIIKLSEEENIIIDHSDSDPFGEENWNETYNGIIWNIPDYFKIFKFLVDSRIEMKSFGNTKIDNFIKVLINWTYGTIVNSSTASKYSLYNHVGLLQVNGVEKIANMGRDILDIFTREYPYNVIYADTDMVFFINFDEIKEKVENTLKEINFKYETEKINTLVLLDKKKYIESDDFNLKTKGLKKISKLVERRDPPPPMWKYPSEKEIEKQIKDLDTNNMGFSRGSVDSITGELRPSSFDFDEPGL